MKPDRESVRWHAVSGVEALQRAAARRILAAAEAATRARGGFDVVLAGGRTPRDVYRRLREAKVDWARWHIYFGDERCLPRDDAGRNAHMAARAWLDHVPIPRCQVHEIPAGFGAEEAAQAYAQRLRCVGDFDLVLLGLGEDGHTASLFPGHAWGTEPDAPDALAVLDAPKPPPQRVTLSVARLSRARAVIFLVEGEAKRTAVARWRAGADIPARAIRPPAGADVLIESRLLRPLAGREKNRAST